MGHLNNPRNYSSTLHIGLADYEQEGEKRMSGEGNRKIHQ